jgi:hypothetical protein
MDRARPAAGGLLHEAPGGGLVAGDAARGPPRHARRPGAHGRDVADAAAEWLRYVELDRQRKPSTVAGYKVLVRSQLLPAFGSIALEE